MAKGQLRSNREQKKPKQPKKPEVPASGRSGLGKIMTPPPVKK
ncbi:MAG: hypothetical protein NT115_07855 [Proteobacteria bacterium]|jgi:hypothetical protein|nr:hypothetical protein [Pseudomonadota bacterium]